MIVKLDGNIIGYSKGYTNEVSSHKAFVPNELIVNNITAGSHSIILESWNGTNSDANDPFTITITELPY